MIDSGKRPRIVGNFIRERREALGLSQRALGLLFTPPVTTQFISNVERGVTPLPPAHVPILVKALNISETELTALLEKEYTFKLSGRLGRTFEGEGVADGNGHASAPASAPSAPSTRGMAHLSVSEGDASWMRALYEAFHRADPKTRQTFASLCESVLHVRVLSGSKPTSGAGSSE